MKNYVTECIGTFFLVLTIGLTVLAETPFAALAIGSALMVMVYMGGHVSGAHYNPAVTLAVYLRGKLELRDVAPYMAAQVAGALLASLVVYVLVGATFAPAPSPDASLPAVLLTEFLFTFALALVVLGTATSVETAGNSYYGLAIGFTVMVGAFAGGGISGGAFNPAVGLGPILVNVFFGGGVADVWIYLVAPLLGGAAAASVFKLQHPHEVQKPAEEPELAAA